MGRLFGTDGIRGIVGQEITNKLALQIGKATATILTQGTEHIPLVVLGRDTRASGQMLGTAISAGLSAAGANVLDLGVISTPAVAFLTQKYKADAGIMISASHNPAQFNGIKIFNKKGFKLPDEQEEQIEQMILEYNSIFSEKQPNQMGQISKTDTALQDYLKYLKDTASCMLHGMKIVVDCANGSAVSTAKELFTQLGVEAEFLGYQPDGYNINQNCGSTHLENLREYILQHPYLQCGVAFDGDADRCLFLDEKGNEIDGDTIMAICGLNLLQKGKLRGNAIVGTVLTNLGFQQFCKRNGIGFEATKVGDRYVLEKMEQEGFVLGGEQSGHIIFRQFATTGDGQLTAVQLLCILKQKKLPLSEIAKIMKKMPQIMLNIPVDSQKKLKFYNNEGIAEQIQQAKQELADKGKVLVRLSGTEPLIRIMVEGESLEKIQQIAYKLQREIVTQLKI